MNGSPAVPRSAFVVFQGGGAKGISHIGAMAALEEVGVHVQGVAGTSAGAIVAALMAAGYEAEQIFSLDGSGKHLLSEIDSNLVSATTLFGKKGWDRLEVLRKLSNKSFRWPTVRHLAFRLVDWWHVPCISVAGVSAIYFGPWWSDIFILGCIGYIGLLIKKALFRAWEFSGGLTTTDEVRRVINKAIVRQLRINPPRPPSDECSGEWSWDLLEREGMTFAQFSKAGGMQLRVVATDITTQTVRLFSDYETPSILVADAVCASIGLPCIFKVKDIQFRGRDNCASRHFFLDGGLLSNLPLWVFDEDRSLMPQALTIGFSLSESINERAVGGKVEMSGLGWLSPAIESIVGGPREIHRRAINGLVVVSIPTSLDVLSFDCTNEEYRKEIKLAKDAACEQLKLQLGLPSQLRANLSSLRKNLVDEIKKPVLGNPAVEALRYDFCCQALLWSKEQDWALHLSLGVQRPGFIRTLKVDITTEESFPSVAQGVILPFQTSLIAEAWRTGNEVVERFLSSDPGRTGVAGKSKWMIALPVRTKSRKIDISDTAVILVVESVALPKLLHLPGGDPQEDLDKLLIYMAFLIKRVLDSFTVDFLRESMNDDARTVAPTDFADHVRSAQIWQ